MPDNNDNSIKVELKYIRRDLDEIKTNFVKFSDTFVSKAEFAPVKNLVYGMVTLVLTGVVGALITLVLR